MESLLHIQALVRTVKLFSIIWFMLFVVLHTAFAQQVRYNYDAAGRLISVTDEQGRTITLDYDALGNLLGVRRVDTVGQVAITLVSPDSGFVGTQVEIIGKGFSNVPNENAIAFNGVSAPVLAANTTSLTTQVPIGATTGPITVKTSSGSATSPQPFTVLVATINVTPSPVTLVRGTSQQFTATISGPSDTRVTWSVNDIVGGNATVGTITSAGLYTAPPPSTTATSSLTVTISATSVAVPGLSATSSVTALATCTIFWTGAGGSNLWQNSANWNTKLLPGANDDTCIGPGFNVTLSSGDPSIRSLNSDSPLTISFASLALAASSTIKHDFTLNSGVLSGAGNFTVSGLMTWTSGTMTGTGTTILNGNLVITGNVGNNSHDLTGGRTLNTNGTTTLSGGFGGFIRMANGTSINNSALWLDQSTSFLDITPFFGAQATFRNTGTYRKSGATTTIGIIFNNTSSGAGTGIVEVQTGTLQFSGGGTANNGSTFTGAVGATLGFSGGTYNLSVGSSVSAATVAFTGGTTNFNGTYSATATSITGISTANFNPGATVTAIGALTILTGTASFSTGGLIAATALTLGSGGLGGILAGTDAVTVSGQAIWTGGTMTGTGVTTLNGNFTLTGAVGNLPHDLTGGRTLNTTGTTTVTGGFSDFIRMANGTSINNSGIWLDQSTSFLSITLLGGGAQATFRNTGIYRKSGAASTTIGVSFNNISPGVVEVQAGTLTLTGGGTHTGEFVTASGASLQFSGGNFNLDNASMGSLRVTTGTVNVAGIVTISGLLELTGSTLNITGQVTVGSYSQSLATLRGTGTLTVSGPATWASGPMADAGTTTFNGNLSIPNIAGTTHDLTGGRILNTNGTTSMTGGLSGFVRMQNGTTINNSGLWLDQSAIFAEIIPFSGAPIFNNSGTYRKTGGDTTTIGVAFNNTGTVEVQGGTLRFTGVYTQTAGTTTLNGGVLASVNALNLPTTLNIQGGILSGVGTVTANVSNAGQVSPGGSAGILNISGTYTQTSAGALNVEIGGLTAGTQFDRLAISGSATLNGILNISLINGFTPNPADSFQIMTFGSRSGTFATINGLDLGGGRSFQVNLTATSLTLVTPP